MRNYKNYSFVFDFKDDAKLRNSFNALTEATFDFNFEGYYKNGYWNERYVPYALLNEGKVIANVSVNILDFYVYGENKRYIQIGTVMTDKAYRNKGLSRYLLEMVVSEWRDKSDMIYLFANDSVLDFYPKFGFTKKLEYQYTKAITGIETGKAARHLDMNKIEDRELLFHLSDSILPFSELAALHNTGLVMFYATSSMKDGFYYIENLDAVVLAQHEGNTLHLNDIFSSQANISVNEVIFAIAKQDTNSVVLGFTPTDVDGYDCEPYLQEDSTLFVLEKDESIFDTHKVMLPILSHA